MSIFQLLLLAFILIPVLEIYVLIQVGGVIGALPTVLAVVGTAVLGATLIRAQGLATISRMKTNLDRGQVPAVEMLEAACLLVAGAFLLTPGFVTDSAGFTLLIPGLRRRIILKALERGVIRAGPGSGPGMGPGNSDARPGHGGRVIEGEFRREDPGPERD